MNKTLITLLFILMGSISYGQYEIGLKMNGGISKITMERGSSFYNHEDNFAPSGQIGMFATRSLNKKTEVTAELFIAQIEGNETSEVTFTSELGEGYSYFEAYKHITYLSLPLSYGYSIKRLTINAGFQISINVYSSGRLKTNNVFESESYTTDEKVRDINVDFFDFGPKAGIIYELTERYSLEGYYYHGISNNMKENGVDWKSKNQQITIGIRYKLNNK